MFNRCAVFTVLFCVCMPAAAFAQTTIGIGGAIYSEDSELQGEERISVAAPQDESYPYESDSLFSGSIWMLINMSDRLRVGGGIEYYGTYASHTLPDEGQDDDDFEPDRYEFGKYLELHSRFDFILNLEDKIDLLLGGVAGIPILFPGGDFQAEIDSLEQEGASVLSLPRIGYVVGLDIGARYRWTDKVAFRIDLLGKFSQVFLFNTTEEVGGIPYDKDWSTRTLRYQLSVGAEFTL